MKQARILIALIATIALAIAVSGQEGPSKTVIFAELNAPLYQSVANQVKITAIGANNLSFAATVDNGKCVRSGDYFVITPDTLGKCELTVFEGKANAGPVLGRRSFTVIAIPTPLPAINGQYGGQVSKNVLLAQTSVGIKMENPAIQSGFTITEFVVSANIQGFDRDEVSRSATITNTQKNLISGLNRGQRVIFFGIKARGPDGKTRDLPAMLIIIG